MLLKRLEPLLSRKRVAIVEACVIGLVSGLAAVLLKQGVELLTLWRTSSTLPLWLVLPTLGLVGGWLSGVLVERLAPEASGSGIPQVKAALGFAKIPLNLRVALVKLGSTLLALGSGLSLGRQGPTVQIGAALAAQLSRWVPTSPDYRRQLISAGAAAGLAAGFNAPIAGVLFVVEELLQDFSDLTLGSAILASFIGAVVSRLLGGQGLNLTISARPISLSVHDLPFLIILGLLAGLLGALFRKGIFGSLAFFRQFKGLGLPGRIGLAGLITGLVGVFVPVAAIDNTGLQEFLVTGSAGWQLIAIAFVAKFLLTLLAYGSGAAGGIFAPSLVLGAALGCLVSFLAQGVYTGFGAWPLPTELASTTTYALTGMGAFFSAVTGVPITAIVIVFEMTANFNLVLPLMIGSGIAYLIADRANDGSIYNRLLALQGIHLEPVAQANNPWAHLRAADLMQRRVETLSSQMSLPEVVQAFSRSHHRGFPVLEAGRLVGIVTQSDLSESTSSGTQGLDHLTLADIMTPHPVTVAPDATLPRVLHLLNRLKLSRLPVTEGNKLVGIITRADIIRAESDQVSGELAELGPQAEPSYVVFQQQAPATGQGRLLVPLADPRTAPDLIKIAAAIAHGLHYELECVHVVSVSRSVAPAEAKVDLQKVEPLRQLALSYAENSGLSVHFQVRAAHEIGRTLLEVIKERHIDLVLMGWHHPNLTPGRVISGVVDTLIRQAPCQVVVVRPGRNLTFDRWLIPTAGGPNAQSAQALLPGLLTLGHAPEIQLCTICHPEKGECLTLQHISEMADGLEATLRRPVYTQVLTHPSVADAIVDMARLCHTDAILLGASRENLLSQVIKGNVPLEIAQDTDITVILLRQVDSSL
ncbi:chloride channel protein [Nodosilinea sp. PGN35]|uniref:chloride channel protein n=1 Tax=Nodosilinea sp. PGN35 TaxID=3020489 RepID=UPI0023B2A575|nr:chloride channel protein [Nodosilinea sp. TSF1-S3]MDF0367299.1 chloride channel protein [Nodosilinea sp. TSF1-S3]